MLFFEDCSLPSVVEVADKFNRSLFKDKIKVVIADTENQSKRDPAVQIFNRKMNMLGLLLHC